jgi:predicted nucleotidyltransferase
MTDPLSDPDVAHDVKVLRQWAQSTPEVQRVILFGSRVLGHARPCSDLDAAVVHGAAPGDANALTTALAERQGWLSELQPHMRLRLDLWSHLGPSDTAKVDAGVKAGSLVIYDLLTV